MWHGYLVDLPKHTRFTIGTKVDNLFTDCLELALLAGYINREEKRNTVEQLSAKFDALKFFLKLLWELKALDLQKYSALAVPMTEIGKMIGGWLQILKKPASPMIGRGML